LDPVAGAEKRGEEDAKTTFEKGKRRENLKTGLAFFLGQHIGKT